MYDHIFSNKSIYLKKESATFLHFVHKPPDGHEMQITIIEIKAQ